MISYEPLFKTLEEKGLSLFKVEKEIGLSSVTTAKFRKGESTTLDTIARICEFLDVPIEKVVEIKR
ncbi:helix-turn-helix domain-containing protein [Lederbergia citri]|uniref:Helix-turn-helix domain-containing protein n=1 Tax=Lederbergia citri TaxID=2833580 RepID=A0A942YFT1_9BACI|nr:helix-turn-helix domain-containing protein [Lederbergia citri]MBS4195378.1 helix-turn-helix domain-containing protein [Lederbergia citri]